MLLYGQKKFGWSNKIIFLTEENYLLSKNLVDPTKQFYWLKKIICLVIFGWSDQIFCWVSQFTDFPFLSANKNLCQLIVSVLYEFPMKHISVHSGKNFVHWTKSFCWVRKLFDRLDQIFSNLWKKVFLWF